MSFPPDLLPSPWYWFGWLVYAVVLGFALWRAPWHFLSDPRDTNVLLGACVALWVMYQFRAGIGSHPGLEYQLLISTTVTLMFGWAFAWLAVSAAQAMMLVQGVVEWPSYALVVLCNGGVGILASYLTFHLAYRRLPRQFFVYVFVCCFFGGALAMLASRLVGMGVLLLSGTYTSGQLLDGDYLPLLPLMMFPEAFLNGGLMTLLVVYRPHWVSSFRDSAYLKGK